MRKTPDNRQEIATVFSIIRNASVPFQQEKRPNRPNLAPTLWRSVADLKIKFIILKKPIS